jgi:hypothetical protein
MTSLPEEADGGPSIPLANSLKERIDARFRAYPATYERRLQQTGDTPAQSQDSALTSLVNPPSQLGHRLSEQNNSRHVVE